MMFDLSLEEGEQANQEKKGKRGRDVQGREQHVHSHIGKESLAQ